VEIRRRDGSVHIVLLDPEDEELVSSAGSWAIKSGGPNSRTTYVHRTLRQNGKKTTEMLHRFLLNPPAHMQVDHINGNGLDNRRSNLRLACRSNNKANAALYRNNTHGFKGATPRHGRWAAQIVRGGQHFSLGTYDTPEEAHAAYCRAAAVFHGEFANNGGKR